ncbi:uncharacterized protein [Dysidea avara]|uniref:uncharacterized protein isoform X2 n=1 Tax=Dysidea avara TaxID=196820 RepID=UPI00331F711F
MSKCILFQSSLYTLAQRLEYKNQRTMVLASYKAFEEDSKASAGPYIQRIILVGLPKLTIIAFSVVIVGFTSELLFSEESNLNPAAFMCYANSGAEKSDHRICHNGIAAAVSSILVCMMLLIFDTFIPCLNKMFKRLAHFFSLLFSIIMAVYLLVTSALLANLYTRYCDEIDEFSKCEEDERRFLVIPVFGFLTMVGWAVVGVLSMILLALGA